MRTPPGFAPWTTLLVGGIAAGGALATLLGARWQRRRGVPPRRALRRAAGWSAVIGSGLAIPLITLAPTEGVQLAPNLVPLRGTAEVLRISGDPRVVARIAGLNIALFVPLGAGVALLRPRRELLAAVLLGGAVSTTVELLQLISPSGRVSDIDDVLLNTLGAALGAAVVRVVRAQTAGR